MNEEIRSKPNSKVKQYRANALPCIRITLEVSKGGFWLHVGIGLCEVDILEICFVKFIQKEF